MIGYLGHEIGAYQQKLNLL